MSGFDVIGDIHGHADELTRLLEAVGYAMCERARRLDPRHPQ